jgi:hypothetical protein
MKRYKVKRQEVVQPLDKPYRLIPLTQGQNAIVDATDFEWLSKWNWCARWSPITKSFYAIRNGKQGIEQHTIMMARQVLQSDVEVDHQNHDTLDNRKNNLRKCTRSENRRNQRLSGQYRGVYWNKGHQKWQAGIGHKGKFIYLGCFDSPKAAALVRDTAAIKYHGEFAQLNFAP